jgi:hypothetical protein
LRSRLQETLGQNGCHSKPPAMSWKPLPVDSTSRRTHCSGLMLCTETGLSCDFGTTVASRQQGVWPDVAKTPQPRSDALCVQRINHLSPQALRPAAIASLPSGLPIALLCSWIKSRGTPLNESRGVPPEIVGPTRPGSRLRVIAVREDGHALDWLDHGAASGHGLDCRRGSRDRIAPPRIGPDRLASYARRLAAADMVRGRCPRPRACSPPRCSRPTAAPGFSSGAGGLSLARFIKGGIAVVPACRSPSSPGQTPVFATASVSPGSP